MGLTGWLSFFLGGGRNVVAETAEVFRVNAEASDQRDHASSAAALAQFAAEFAQPRRSLFDGFVDGLNRLPRPFMALGVIALFTAAMVDPIWFSARMVGLQSVPEPLWYILGAIVSFFFGARELHKNRAMTSIGPEAAARTVQAVREIKAMAAPAQEPNEPNEPNEPKRVVDRVDGNPALDLLLDRSDGGRG